MKEKGKANERTSVMVVVKIGKRKRGLWELKSLEIPPCQRE